MITQPSIFVGVFYAAWMFIIFSLPTVFNHYRRSPILFTLALNAVIWGIGGIIFAKFQEKRQNKLDQQLGQKLTGQDKIDLFIWYKYGIKTKTAHLQTVLGKYLDYLEGGARGRNFNNSGKSRVFALIVFAVMFVLQAVVIIADLRHSAGSIGLLIFFGLIVTLVFVSKPGKTNSLFEMLGSRSFAKIARMRRQLE